MASPADLLTAAQNIVTALNQLGQTFLKVYGTQKSASLTNTAGALVTSGSGRLVSVSVTVASGAVLGTVYDSSSATSLINPIATIPFAVGVTSIGVPFSNGIVVVLPSTITAVLVY